MKRTFLYIFVYLLCQFLLTGCGKDAGKMSPQAIEDEVSSIYNGQNIEKGKLATQLEEQYHIVYHKDGVWNCQDRAEVARQLATKYGYRSVYRWNKVHMWLCIYDDAGKPHEILTRMSGKEEARRQFDEWSRDTTSRLCD